RSGGRLRRVSENVQVFAAGEMTHRKEMRALGILPARAAMREGESPKRLFVRAARLHPQIAVRAASASDHARLAYAQQITNYGNFRRGDILHKLQFVFVEPQDRRVRIVLEQDL